MSVTIHWDNPDQTALIMTLKTPWTWDEIEALSPAIGAEMDAVVHDVDLIIDLRQSGDVPMSMMDQLRDAYAEGMSNLGQYIFVGASEKFVAYLSVADRYLTAMGGTLDYRCVDSMEEARRISYWKHLLRPYAV